MKNTARKETLKKKLKSKSLDRLVSNGNGDNVIYVRNSGEWLTNYGIQCGNLLVCDMSRKPSISDLVLYEDSGEHYIKPNSEVQRFIKPLRLTGQNGKAVNRKILFNSCTVLGRITHLLRNLYSEVTL